MEENQIQIPEGWAKQKGDNLFKVQGGFAFKSNDYKDEGVLLVRISNVGNNNFIYKDLIYVPKRFLTSHSNFLLDKDDVLMGLTGDLGKICILENGEFPFILNQRVGRFIFNEKVNNRFLYYLISSSTIQNKFDAFFTGGAQKNISPSQIESVEYIVPKSTTEQQSIANILSRTDQAIARTEALIAKYSHIKIGLMQDLLTKGIDENGNIRTEQTHEFKDSPLGRIPKEWECEKLNFASNIFISGVDKKSHLGEKAVSLCNYMDVYANREIYTKIDFMKATAADAEIKKFQLKVGDVIITKDSETPDDIAVPTVVKEVFDNLICGYHLAIIRPKSNLLGNYLMFQLLNHSSKKYFGGLATGSTRFGLKLGAIENFPVFIPKLSEQRKVVSIIDKNHNLIIEENQKLSKLQSLKKGLMQDLLSGKVRVNNLNANKIV
ncbi:MAG: restriction endonuclease subunit S [Sediminibacterium sp.]|nr:restriction endonuclease subunit S [Sediminibacterium sp.]